MVGRSLRSLTLVAAILSPSADALADPSYSAGITGVQSVNLSPTPVFLITNVDQTTGGHIEGTASADRALGARLETFAPARGLNTGISTQGSSDLVATFDDIVLTGPGTDPIPFTLRVPFHLVFFQDWSTLDFDNGDSDASQVSQSADIGASLSPLFGRASGRIVVTVDDWNGTANVGLGAEGSSTVVPPASPINPLDADGFLNLVSRVGIPIGTGNGVEPAGAGFAVHDAVGLSGVFVLSGSAPVATPLTLELRMSIDSRSFGGFGLTATGWTSALNAIGLPGLVPVFDLPDGYTANSPSLRLVDDVFVPEPDGPALWAVAMAALAIVRRRRSGRVRGADPLYAGRTAACSA
jgi:uncharacterized protein (TIGR03382 family)